jgi:hypothetical protein
LKLIVGPRPSARSPLRYAQNRLQLIFQRFIKVLALPEDPLTHLLDGLQQLDPATLDKAFGIKVNSLRGVARGMALGKTDREVDQG